MKFLLDTQAILWAVMDDSLLGKQAKRAIERSNDTDLAISDITLLEIAMLLEKGRIEIQGASTAFLSDLTSRLQVLPIDPFIAIDAMELSLPHADPFDRTIVATARRHGLILLTKDQNITQSKQVPTLW